MNEAVISSLTVVSGLVTQVRDHKHTVPLLRIHDVPLTMHKSLDDVTTCLRLADTSSNKSPCPGQSVLQRTRSSKFGVRRWCRIIFRQLAVSVTLCICTCRCRSRTYCVVLHFMNDSKCHHSFPPCFIMARDHLKTL